MGDEGLIVEIFIGRASRAKLPPPTPPGFEARLASDDSDEMLAAGADADPIGGVPLGIVYVDARGQETRRRITCRSLSGNLLHAWCHERRALRAFRIDRIRELVDWRTGEVLPSAAAFFSRPGAADAEAAALARCRVGLRILIFLSRCDGEFHPLEREVVADYCGTCLAGDTASRPPMPDLSAHLSRVVAYGDRLYPDVELFASSIARVARSGRPALRRLVDHAGRLIDADGVHDEREFRFAQELSALKARL